mmetsp:Transcript_33027/g.105209  ORF Transcript_33027/g.105209 Transcript_33027/m.105209 type:complete len:253 (+) Transcript_33027:1265-2023(+)
MEPPGADVEVELSDGDPDALDSEVPEAEDAGAVGDDDGVDVARRPVVGYGSHFGHIVLAEVHAARAPEEGAVELARESHGGGVDDIEHFGEILHHQLVEQGLVAVLEVLHHDPLADHLPGDPALLHLLVIVDVVDAVPELFEDPVRLGLQIQVRRGQQAADLKAVTLGRTESRTFVEDGVVNKIDTLFPDDPDLLPVGNVLLVRPRIAPCLAVRPQLRGCWQRCGDSKGQAGGDAPGPHAQHPGCERRGHVL